MQKNWYIVYTKARREKKVSGLLSKKKIKNFCPLNGMLITKFGKGKLKYEPLFMCNVFAYVQENEIALLKKIDGVINLLYWKGKPATVKEEEIEALKDFTTHHLGIKLEKFKVDTINKSSSKDCNSYTISGKLLMIKTRAVKVNLPSLGFAMIAEIEEIGIMGREVAITGKEFVLQ